MGLVRVNACVLTVKPTALLVPPEVVTDTEPLLALLAMVKVAVICVELTTLRPLTVMPAGTLRVAPDVKLVPVKVTETLVPCTPLAGPSEARVGDG